MGNVGKWTLVLAVCGAACGKGRGADPEKQIAVVVPPDAGPVTNPGTSDGGVPDPGPVDAGPAPVQAVFGTPGPWPIANVTYGSADGIQESPVVAVSTDEPVLGPDGSVSQNLWVATNQALYLMKPGEKQFRRYDATHGLHLQNNPVMYCDGDIPGDRLCLLGAAAGSGIISMTGGGPDEVFVGYESQHDWNDPQDGTWFDKYRHTGKIDRVRVNRDGTLQVDRFDLVSGNTPNFWHNRTIYRMVYDHFIHKHELYVGTEHGIDKITPDKFRYPKQGEWRFQVNLEWLSDHLHPRTCRHQKCTDDERKDTQMMGGWRGLAIAPDGDLWVGGHYSAGQIIYAPLNAAIGSDGKPDASGSTGWFQRPGGVAYRFSFGTAWCGSAGQIQEWVDGTGWVMTSCPPFSGTPPVFMPAMAGEVVSITAVTVTPDGVSWWASAPVQSGEVGYGVASFDGHQFTYYDPARDFGMRDHVWDMVALPDGRLVLAGTSSGLTIWDPKTRTVSGTIRAGTGLPDDRVTRLELDMMVSPPALHVATRGGATVLRVLP